MKATCSSCGAAILWTVTEAGKRMPVDATPSGKATVLVRNPDDPNTPISKQRDVYLSHFATCEHAASHRKTTTKPAEQDSTEKESE
jgi:hypothetical protein